MAQNANYIGAFNQAIPAILSRGAAYHVQDPACAFFPAAIRQQNRASQTPPGLGCPWGHVPHFMIDTSHGAATCIEPAATPAPSTQRRGRDEPR
jgi:hypothetical protein